jgi:hypothetical protein
MSPLSRHRHCEFERRGNLAVNSRKVRGFVEVFFNCSVWRNGDVVGGAVFGTRNRKTQWQDLIQAGNAHDDGVCGI